MRLCEVEPTSSGMNDRGHRVGLLEADDLFGVLRQGCGQLAGHDRVLPASQAKADFGVGGQRGHEQAGALASAGEVGDLGEIGRGARRDRH